MLHRYVLLILLAWSITGLAQTDTTLLPAKQSGKWGYINKSGSWVIPPKFDDCYAFDGRAFTWAKMNGENYVLNRNGKIEKLVSFGDIVIISNDILVYRDKGVLGWTNRQGNYTIPAEYTEVSFSTTPNHLIVRDTMWYLVVDYRNNTILHIDSAASIRSRSNYYEVNNKYGTGLYSTNSKEILPCKFDKVLPLTDYLIGYLSDDEVVVHDTLGHEIFSGQYSFLGQLQNNYFRARRNGYSYLIDLEKGEVVDSGNVMYTSLGGSLIKVQSNDGNGIFHTDSNKRVIPTIYTRLDPQIGSDYLIAQQGGQLGLLAQSGESITPIQYDDIGEFKDGFCIVKESSGYGLIDLNGKKLQSSTNVYISVGDGGVIKMRKPRAVKLIEYDSIYRIKDSMTFTNVGVLNLDGSLAVGMNSGRARNNNTISSNWFQNEKGKWGLTNDEDEVIIKPLYDEVIKLTGTPLVMGKIFARQRSTLTSTVRISSGSSYGVIDEVKYKPIIQAGLMYVDTAAVSDSLTNVFRVMNSAGYFATIHKETGRVRRYNSKYVSSYSDGYARIFLGTKLKLAQEAKYCFVHNIQNFLSEFNLIVVASSTTLWQQTIDGRGYWGYIDKNGLFINSPEFFKQQKIILAKPFRNGRAIIANNDSMYAMINGKCEFVLLPQYKSISFLPYTGDSLIKTEVNTSRYGYVSTSGITLAKPIYSKALPFSDNATWCFTDNVTTLLRKDGSQDTFHSIRKITPFYNERGGISSGRRQAIVTSSGEILTDFNYRKIGEYAEELLPAKSSKYFGYLNDEGEWEINPIFQQASRFTNGVAAVKIGPPYHKRAVYHYIDTEGKIISGNKYSRAYPIDNYGYGQIQKNGKKGLVGSNGKEILAPKFKTILVSENHITTLRKNTVSLRDRNGRKIYTSRGSKHISRVSDGKLVVKKFRNYGVVDTLGNLMLPFKYRKLEPFENGISIIQRHNVCYVIYENGDTIGQVTGRQIGGFRDGFVLIRRGENNYVFVNPSGLNTFNLNFQEAKPFQNGLAVVKIDGKYGVIDASGYFRIKPSYDGIKSLVNGVAITEMKTAVGICDLNAHYITSPTCNDIEYLPYEQVYQYHLNNEYGYVSKSGDVFWKI